MIAKVVNETALLLGTKRLVTSPYRPQSNSEVEIFNYSPVKQLQGFVDPSSKDWDKFIWPVQFAYNVSVCVDSTGYEPFYLMYGRMPRSPFSTTLPRPPDVSSAKDKEYLHDLVQGLQFAHEKARKNMAIQKAKMKEQYDKNVYTEDYKVEQSLGVLPSGQGRRCTQANQQVFWSIHYN